MHLNKSGFERKQFSGLLSCDLKWVKGKKRMKS